MVRQALAVMAVGLLVGCAGGGNRRQATSDATPTMVPPALAMSDTALAAHAGDAEFPTDRPSDDRRVAAIVTADGRTIKLYNFESEGIRAVNVWVNGAYVQPLRAIPPHSKAPIRTDKLFNKFGQRFSERGEQVTRVQLETSDGVYNVMGPATE